MILEREHLINESCPWKLETESFIFHSRSVVACMSPVVPVNCMLALAERGYGEDKELSSLLFAAVSIDDIHIVSVYAICYSFIFNHRKIIHQWPFSILDVILYFFLNSWKIEKLVGLSTWRFTRRARRCRCRNRFRSIFRIFPTSNWCTLFSNISFLHN